MIFVFFLNISTLITNTLNLYEDVSLRCRRKLWQLWRYGEIFIMKYINKVKYNNILGILSHVWTGKLTGMTL